MIGCGLSIALTMGCGLRTGRKWILPGGGTAAFTHATTVVRFALLLPFLAAPTAFFSSSSSETDGFPSGVREFWLGDVSAWSATPDCALILVVDVKSWST